MQAPGRGGLRARFRSMSLRRIPPLTTGLLLANVALFAATTASGGADSIAVLAVFGAKIDALIWEGEWWRIVASAFLHGSVLHIAVNAYALLLLGAVVERAYGVRRMLVVYAAGAVGGGLASLLLTRAPSVGASGAIYGLLGTAVWLRWLNRHRMPLHAQRLFWTYVIPFLGFSLALGFVFPAIDPWAHLGGLAGGVLAALPWGNPLAPEPGSRAASAVATALGIVGGGVLLAGVAFAAWGGARASLWSDARLRDGGVAAAGVRLAVPRGWADVTPPGAQLERAFADRLGGLVILEVRPYVSGEEALLRSMETELAELRRAAAVSGPERVTVGAGTALRFVVEGRAESAPVVREILVLGGRGRGAVLALHARPEARRLYRALFDRMRATFALEEAPALARGWEWLAAGNAARALPWLERALAGPSRPLALQALARAHRQLGQLRRALARAVAAARQRPTDSRALGDLARALQAVGWRSEAIEVLAAGRRVARLRARSLMVLAQTAHDLGLERQAIALYEDIIGLRRDFYPAYNNLAWLLVTARDPTLRNPEKAVRLALVAVAGEKGSATFLDTLAEAQFAVGRRAEAVATAKEALRLAPGDEYLKKQLARFERGAGPRPVPDRGAPPVPEGVGPVPDGSAPPVPEGSVRPVPEGSVRPVPEGSVRPVPEGSVRPVPGAGGGRGR